MSPNPLTIGMVGEGVRALQHALAAFGFDIPETEMKRRFFGPGTREAVKQCQARSGLAPSGVCDKGTSALLGLLDVREAPSAHPQPKTSGESPRIDVPPKESPRLTTNIRSVRTLEYASLAGIEKQSAQKLLERGLTFDRLNDSMFSRLVKEGVLNERQKADLHLTIELGKLTGDNLPLISSLKTKSLKSIADVIGWEKERWRELITKEKIPLPPNETSETYADNIFFSLEHSLPSQFLFDRLSSHRQADRFILLDSLNEARIKNGRLIDGVNPASLDWGNIDAKKREKLQADLQSLTEFANTYRRLGVAELINENADPRQKKNAISARLKLLDTFYQNNSSLDLRLVNFFGGEDSNLNWESIPISERPLVRKQLMAYQRVLSLTGSTDDRQKLLGSGYDSAIAITGKTESEFILSSSLPHGRARMIYSNARGAAVAVSHAFAMVHEETRGQFGDLTVANRDPGILNYLRDIDGFADIFGPLDYCDCEQCRSILGPAAYFVDLMRYIEQHISKPVFITPVHGRPGGAGHPLYLKNRRPDLWSLRLTCENTHTPIPYLTIVNEVLESHLGDIYETLGDPGNKISFSLPFNLPLAELRIYLSHFGVALSDVYRILKEPEMKTRRARLNLSQEEFHVITNPDAAGVKYRFGASTSNLLAVFPLLDFYVDDYGDHRGFIKFAGISRQQLDELLRLRFKPDLANITVEKQPLPDELQNFPEILRNLTSDRLDFIHRFVRLWRKTSWSIPELDLVLLSLQEAGMIGSDLNNAIGYLAQLIDFQEKLKLTVEELCSLVNDLPVSRDFPKTPAKRADLGIYERLFDLKKLFGENPNTHEINRSAIYHHYSLNRCTPNDHEIDPKTPILLGGLGVSETELLLLFELLKEEMPFDVNGDTIDRVNRPAAGVPMCPPIDDPNDKSTFDRRRISLLYRHARLAKALKLKIEDFIGALHLNFGPAQSVIKSLSQIHQLIEFKQWLKISPFSVSDFRFILEGEEAGAAVYRTNLETAGAIVLEVQASQIWNDITTDVAIGIVREIQRSRATDKTAKLKESLEVFFHLSSDRMTEILNLAGRDLDSAGIQRALNIDFDAGVSHPDINELLDLLNEIAQALKIGTLKASLAKLFNLSANQLDDALQWAAGDIRSAGVATALNAAFIEVASDAGPKLAPQTAADLDSLVELMKQIERALSIFSKLKLKETTVGYLTAKPNAFGVADLKRLSLFNLKAITFYRTLVGLMEEAEPKLQAALDNYLATQGEFSSNDLLLLGELRGQGVSLIESLVHSLALPAVPIEAVEYLWEGLDLCQILGVNGYSLQKLAGEAEYPSAQPLAKAIAAREVALGAFSSKYDDEAVRREKLEPYQDQINVIKRDALCDYIIARRQDLKFKDYNDIYAFLLLDVEMSGCFRVSRVLSAISSLQLYMHRVLMNLEQSAFDSLSVLSRIDEIELEQFRQEWEWRKNYRVWEANRKVFLFAENYVEPDLRDNKSQIFKELEDELLQEKITKDSAEFAYRKYLAGFTELAKLRIVGSCHHTNTDFDIYYLFGRTHTNPYQYYYRTLMRKRNAQSQENTNVWGNWIKMELAVDAREISALMYMERLYVFWTQVERREISVISDGDASSGGHIFKVYAKYSYLYARHTKIWI